MWVRRQPPKVKTFLAVVSGMAALVLLRVIVNDHDNLFVAAEAVHSIGISVLIYKLTKEKTCAVLALCIHPTTFHNLLNRISWAFCVYLEAISVLPQLRVMQNTKIVEPFTAHYVFALGVARDKVVYELYTDYVLKNPFYEMEMSIRFELFDINLTQAVQKDRVALLGR
ncbi:hypothetical protein E1A91_D12G158000v1 [Gossypium mustelinum]|uniref:ER lumen protein-retaining receptor n=1 Tax=Gossypium mustelinum TaxID=34275 RepID=A0A5D2SEB4_GOSMU|nr:hypothetical protein E1A91_D12G158000v1 [Gossypium mustelinum]